MTTTLTIANSTLGASRTISISDADTTRLADALIATRYPDDTRAQAIMQALGDWIGDLKALVYAYEQQQTAPAPIASTG